MLRRMTHAGRRTSGIVCGCALGLFGISGFGFRSSAPIQTVAYTGAIIHPVSGPPVESGVLLVQAGKIVACGADVKVPEGTRTVDLAGLHLYPGFVAAETSLGLVEIGSVEGTDDTTEAGWFNPHVRAESAVNPDSELIGVARSNGVLTALAVPRGSRVAGRSALIRLTGRSWEEMTLRAPVALHLAWPQEAPRRRGAKKKEKGAKKREEDRGEELRALREAFASARAYLKADSARGQPGVLPLDVDPQWEALRPVLARRIPVVVHAHGEAAIRSAVLWAQEEDVRLVVSGGRDAWRVADLLREKRVPVILTATNDVPRDEGIGYDANFRSAAELCRLGVPFCIADPGAASNARNLPYGAALAAAHGLPRDEALKAITLYAARILGVEEELGSLDAGKRATFFAADGDPLDVRTKVLRAWIDGEELDLSDRHKRLYERYRKKQ